MFENLRKVNTNAISDFRGFVDPSNLTQFNQFEGGYSIFTVVSIPYFLYVLATSDKHPIDPKTGVEDPQSFKQKYGDLIKTYVLMLENEFRGISGLDDISTDTADFTNGITTISMINKVTQQSNGTFSMTYTEKAGAPITRTHELFLTGIKDPRTMYKTYHGLINSGAIELEKVGFQSECFSFLYMVTDNTGLRLEKSFYIVGAQPTSAQINDLYNSEKGSYDFKEISCEFTGNVLTGSEIDKKAEAYLRKITNTTITSDETGKVTTVGTGAGSAQYDLVTTDFSQYDALTNSHGSNVSGGSYLGDKDTDLDAAMNAIWRNKLLK